MIQTLVGKMRLQRFAIYDFVRKIPRELTFINVLANEQPKEWIRLTRMAIIERIPHFLGAYGLRPRGWREEAFLHRVYEHADDRVRG